LQKPQERMGFGVGQPHVLYPKEWQLFGKLFGKSPQNAAAGTGVSR